MVAGFEKVVEERILRAQRNGEFENLSGNGKPLALTNDSCVSEEFRLAYKILKNADCIPPELELKKEIKQIEDLLAGMGETAEKYRAIKKLNFLIMKLNSTSNKSIRFEVPQKYELNLVERFGTKGSIGKNR